MVEIYNNLYVGSIHDFEQSSFGHDWALVNACKKIKIGKKTASQKVLFEDYLFLNTGSNINLAFFNCESLHLSFSFIEEKLQKGKNVLLFCDLGGSASPLVAIGFLSNRLNILPNTSLEDAEDVFYDLYIDYNPKFDMRQAAQQLWSELNR